MSNAGGGTELSGDATDDLRIAAEPGDSVLHFVGGPLDGRVEVRAARHGEPLATVTHVHLHDGPKVVHRYDLNSLDGRDGVYRLRPPARKVARDESVAD